MKCDFYPCEAEATHRLYLQDCVTQEKTKTVKACPAHHVIGLKNEGFAIFSIEDVYKVVLI